MVAGQLYIGSVTPEKVGQHWMVDNHPSVRRWATANRDMTLLNAGTVGGDRHTMQMFTKAVDVWLERNADADLTDMGGVNYVAHMFPDIVTDNVATKFRAMQYNHPTALWRHK
jgi:hypothetical protein